MLSILTVLAASASYAAADEITLLTGRDLGDGRTVSVKIEPPMKDAAAGAKLLDGDARTSHHVDSGVTWREGATPTTTLDLHAVGLVTEIHVGYAGGIKLTSAERRLGGLWSPLPEDVWQHAGAKYPKTSWLVADRLAVRADAVRFRWSISSGGGQLTEFGVLGMPTDSGGPLADLAVSPRLPVAYKPAEVLVDLLNRHASDKRQAKVQCRILDDQGREMATASCAPGQVQPLRSATIRIPLTMSGPGCYTFEAAVDGQKGPPLSGKFYVLNRELQFIWYGVPEEAKWATMLTTVSSPIEIRRWQRRGVVPLGWTGGYCYRDKYDEDGFTQYWTEGLRRHPVGLAVDEFGNHFAKPTDREMANALLRAHRAVPDKMMVIWQAGVSPPETASAYQVAADWIIPECYMNYFSNNFKQFEVRIEKARSFGLMHKTVMGICTTSDKIGTTAEGLVKQVRYLRRVAPEMPGLGFYKAYGTGAKLAPLGDALCFEYFIKPTLLIQKDRRKRGRALVRNIGALPAKDVHLEYCIGSDDALRVIQTCTIPRLDPDAVREIQLDADKIGEDRVTLRAVPSSRYSCVSDPVVVRTGYPGSAK